ncbi:hypothetical protein GCM10009347_37210 [Shewanella algicola]|uniref:Uncharacterized protein n=1 Tax=Shewanella algicola TaxID=640633 RepID=A0A9X2CFI1_9GAMM|nr:hypothetical protein [Shewanella algicola]MCL1107427.1 hypothetical protein [Shewanella algicola]GGP68403.1 hypothetical protein GCM10009347_37210 [Shewanella algicola]
MSPKLSMHKKVSFIEEIVAQVECVAIEYAFNLEVITFDEVLRRKGITKPVYEGMYVELSEF